MNDTGNGSAPDNPMGTDGFEFVEYTAPDPEVLGELFEQLGFSAVARHRSKDVILYRQGRVNFIVNREPDSFAQSFARVHGPSACAFAMRVKDAAKAYKRAIDLGAKPHHGKVGPMELNIPAIQGIGGSLIYLVDRYPGNGGDLSIYDVDFVPLPGAGKYPKGAGLQEIDHLTHNVYVGRMDTWAQFYEKLFNHVAGVDEPVREDPHPDQRAFRYQIPDPGIPRRISRRGHPAHRALVRGHL